jgi:hypothetical protein
MVGPTDWVVKAPSTKAQINDFYQILDFATDPEPKGFPIDESPGPTVRSSSQAGAFKALAHYPTTIVATHVPPYEGAAWHKGATSSPDYQPFFSSPTMGDLVTAAAAHGTACRRSAGTINLDRISDLAALI